MSKSINFKRELETSVEDAVERITSALKTEGFGILTRIDLHSKVKEKLGKDLKPVVILGACNPQLAFDAYELNTDVASLLPCNAVIRETSNGNVSIELLKPSSMMAILGDQRIAALASEGDVRLQKVLERM